MISLLITIAIAVLIVVALWIAVDCFAKMGGDARLWWALKGLIVVVVLLYVLQNRGAVVL